MLINRLTPGFKRIFILVPARPSPSTSPSSLSSVQHSGGMAYPGDTHSSDYFFAESTLEGRNGFEGHNWAQALQTEYLGSGNKPGTHMNTAAHTHVRSENQRQMPSDVHYDPRSPSSTFRNYPQAHAYPPHIDTSITYRTEGELSPFSPSPSSFSNQLYVGGHYTGSTPSLASSVSSPPTGRSANLLLTPESGLLQGTQLSRSPSHFHGSAMQLPAERAQDCGATPELTGLNLDEYGFQLAINPGRSQQSSVLLGSNDGPQTSATDLDPLDDHFVGLENLGGQTPNVVCPSDLDDGGYSIHIQQDPDSANNRAIPISVVLDDLGTWNRSLLSPLAQLQGLPIGYQQVAPNYTNQVVIQPASWGGPFTASQATSPAPSPSNTSPLHNRRLPPPTSSPSSSASEFAFSGNFDRSPTTQQAAGNFHELKNSPTSPGHEILQAARSGKYPQLVINPKGVSERTLAAAEANRKRVAKFQCHICHNSQTSKQNLDNHIMSRHMQLKRFPCPFPGCSAKYGHARGVNRHLDSKHPGFRQVTPRGKRGPSKGA